MSVKKKKRKEEEEEEEEKEERGKWGGHFKIRDKLRAEEELGPSLANHRLPCTSPRDLVECFGAKDNCTKADVPSSESRPIESTLRDSFQHAQHTPTIICRLHLAPWKDPTMPCSRQSLG